MRGQLIGFAGYAKSGKNLAADLIREKDYSWEIVSFAGRLKQISSLLTGLDVRIFENKKDLYLHGWGMTIREFLQKLGTDAIRNHFHEDTWVNALLADYHQSDKWLITDVRFPNEANAIKQYGGKVIRINRDGIEPARGHSSETALDEYQFDYVIDNNSTVEELKQKLWSIL